MNRLIRRMWENRGYSDDFLREINECNHSLPTNIDVMCERLKHYHASQERIVLLTDFDMDGITAGIVGFAGLAELGFNVALYLPDTDAYGFDEKDIDAILEEYPDVKAIVTADVGISAYDGVNYAVEKGIEMLVTDHHQPVSASLPNSSVFVDPVCDSGDEYFGGICGAHVLYLVLRYYAMHFHDDPKNMVPQIDRLRVFAGFGTVSDSMPVYYENRPLIRDAVAICRLVYGDGERNVVDMIPGCDVYRRAFLGLFVMLKVFKEHRKIQDSNSIDETFFGFYIAPAFNSIKRMNGDIVDAYNVFFGGDELAEEAMEKILLLTDERKKLVEDSLAEMLSVNSYQPWAPYVFITSAKAGVRGLLAQRIMSLTGEPALVVGYGADGNFVGSGRCPTWFPFLELTAELDFVHAAGHNPAFGVSIDGDAACADLVAFMRHAIVQRKPKDLELLNRPDFKISTVDDTADTDIDVELFEDFLSEIEMYRPFGAGFPAPDVELEFRPKDAFWSYLGKDKNHIKVVLPQGLVLLCFNQAVFFPDDIREELMPDVISVRGKLNTNDFNGIRTIQFLGHLGEEMNQSSIMDDVVSFNEDKKEISVTEI